jgi:hypothetical protein
LSQVASPNSFSSELQAQASESDTERNELACESSDGGPLGADKLWEDDVWVVDIDITAESQGESLEEAELDLCEPVLPKMGEQPIGCGRV